MAAGCSQATWPTSSLPHGGFHGGRMMSPPWHLKMDFYGPNWGLLVFSKWVSPVGSRTARDTCCRMHDPRHLLGGLTNQVLQRAGP